LGEFTWGRVDASGYESAMCAANRLKKGLDAVTSDEVTDDSEADEPSTDKSQSSFDVPPSAYVAPPSGGSSWLSGFLSSSETEPTSAAVDNPVTTAPVPAGTSGNRKCLPASLPLRDTHVTWGSIESRRAIEHRRWVNSFDSDSDAMFDVVEISDACSVQLVLQYAPHAVVNRI